VTRTIERVVLVGGGSTAWLSAAALRRAFRSRGLDVLVVDTGAGESSVGRWTLPSQRGMHALLGIQEGDLMRRTGATYKLASEHVGWQGDNSRFLHAHGDIGTDLGGTPFYKFLLLQAIAGRFDSPENYSVAAAAARLGRFARPMGADDALTSSFTYGFHLEEAAYADFLREHALGSGVRSVAGPLGAVNLLESGNIGSLTLATGEKISGDYFLDCSGGAALLAGKVFSGTREDWSVWLPCDRMLSALAPATADPAPLTRTIATAAGWLWQAPLARATIAGYVYSSRFTSDDSAFRQLNEATPGIQANPVLNRFASGRRRNFWERNCVALGAAAVELEPLAGADLHLAQLGVGTLIELFPLDAHSTVESEEYNRVMGEHADALRDFTLAHYRAGRARAGEFWAQTRAAPPPQRLADKLDLFSANGRINLLDFESFEEVDWAWLLMGARLTPAALELQIRTRLENVTPQQIAPLRTYVERLAASMPRHFDYLQRVQVTHAAKP
jgi:tryptophan halogenase